MSDMQFDMFLKDMFVIFKQEAHGPYRSPEKTVQIIKQI